VHFARLANILLKDEDSARDNHVVACNFAKYSPIKKFRSETQQETFLMGLLTTPPGLKYAATLPCNLSLMACFGDNSQGSVADICKVRWDFKYPFNCKFTRESSSQKNSKSVNI